MNPPPPIPHEDGLTTPSAKDVAMAASTALPPWRSMVMPASDASRCPDATMPCSLRRPKATAGSAQSNAANTHHMVMLVVSPHVGGKDWCVELLTLIATIIREPEALCAVNYCRVKVK